VGLFQGIEFVADKVTREPFDLVFDVAKRVQEMALSTKYSLAIYRGNGTVDGVRGDHIILSPALNSTTEFIETMVERVFGAINDTFDDLDAETHGSLLLNSVNALKLATNNASTATTTDFSTIHTPGSIDMN
jgi:hypothetical protein